MALGLIPIVHIVAAVFSIVELGLTGYAVSMYNGYNGYNGYWNGYYGSWSPDRVNFMLFNSIWSILVLVYVGLTPLYMTSIFHRLAALILEAITMLFWFAGAIALAVLIGVPRCGSDNLCGSLQASVAFGFFLWVLFAVLVVIDGLEAMRSRRSGVHADKHHHHTTPYAGA